MKNSEAYGETCLKFIFLLPARKSKEKAEKNLSQFNAGDSLFADVSKARLKVTIALGSLGRSGFMISDHSDCGVSYLGSFDAQGSYSSWA